MRKRGLENLTHTGYTEGKSYSGKQSVTLKSLCKYLALQRLRAIKIKLT